ELTAKVGSGKIATPLQEYIDQIMLGFFPALFYLVIYWLLGKKVKTTTLLVGVILLSIFLAALGIAKNSIIVSATFHFFCYYRTGENLA
ncbi:PTS system mannose/fructose/sorbose family transporter subunit IID, partial [Enterococcus faecalis]|uniref:PTS system mannose/fructose/sorbose family transporter subunit IID n=1 Tax=Enterococcus faecalis TaxID=1351 RepID=UPI003CC69243